MKGNIKHILSAFIDADHPTARLIQLAELEFEAIWNDLLAREVSELAAWLLDRQMAAQGQAQIEWTYIRAVFTSIQQEGGPLRGGDHGTRGHWS